MKKLILAGSLLLLPFNAKAITTTVPAGTTQTGGDINSVVTQKVYGEANDFTISGQQQVMSGGLTHNSVVNTYGQQTVYSGGTSYDTTIQSQGLQVVAGQSYSSLAQAYGSINVNSGGTAYSSTIDGGTISVLSGGTSSGTILNSGTESVTGTSTGSIINGGTQKVNRYGKVQNAQLQGGTQNIAVRGTATNTTITSGTQEVYGDSMKSNLKGGVMNIYSTGYAENTIVSGGVMNVNSGAFSSQTSLQDGTQNIYGQDINGIITGGTQNVLDGGIAEDTTISGGTQNIESTSKAFNNIISASGIQQVASGGYSYRSQVSSGGQLNVSGGAYEADISSGGTMNILSSGLAQDTTVSGGVMNVNSGASSQNTALTDGTINIYGTNKNSTISGGVMNIYGSDTDSTINSGIQNVQAGATATSSIINSSGTQNIYGTSVSAAVNGGILTVYDSGLAQNAALNSGTMNIEQGGSSQDTTISGGVMNVNSGASSQNTTLTDGTINIYGTNENSTISGGIMNVYGSDTNTKITNGIMNIYGPTTNFELTAYNQTGGTSTSAIISSSGVQNIYAGGISNSAQINLGGKQIVYTSGTASQSTLNGGVQIVYGTADNTIVNSGLQEIRSGGHANSSQINNGGILTVEDGGTAYNATFYGGTLRLQPGGLLSGTTSATDSIINISGNHTIPDLQLDNSLVNISRQAQYSDVTLSNLNGNGIFVMSSDLSAGLADQINITNGDGDFGLIINDYSSSTVPDKFKIISEDSTAADKFYLVGGAVDIGAYQYKLLQTGGDWFLEHTKQLSDGVYIAKNTFTALSSLFYSHLTPVYGRLHFQHRPQKHDNGLWIKGINRYVKQSYVDDSRIKNDIYGSVIGFDHNFSLGTNYHIITGLYTGFTSSKQKFDTSGKGTGQTKSFGLYSTILTSNNWFLDLVGSRFSHHQKTTGYTPASTEVIGRFNTTGWQAAFALGKRFNFASSWFVEPFIGMDYMYIKGISYRSNFNTLITADDADYLSNSFGLTAGKSFNITPDISLDVYTQVALSYDWDTKAYIEVADYSITEDLSSLHYEFSAGVNIAPSDFGSGYIEIGTNLGQHVDIPWEINIGYQYDF